MAPNGANNSKFRNITNWRQLAPILGQSPIGACAMIDSLFFNILVDESLPNISKTLIYRAWRGNGKCTVYRNARSIEFSNLRDKIGTKRIVQSYFVVDILFLRVFEVFKRRGSIFYR